jgi:hypothetical protein
LRDTPLNELKSLKFLYEIALAVKLSSIHILKGECCGYRLVASEMQALTTARKSDWAIIGLN